MNKVPGAIHILCNRKTKIRNEMSKATLYHEMKMQHKVVFKGKKPLNHKDSDVAINLNR